MPQLLFDFSGEDGVEYRDLPGHPGYRIGSDGSVWGSVRGNQFSRRENCAWRRHRPQADRRGYLRVKVSGRRRYVHKIVLLAFVGPCPEGRECCHNDGDPANNRLENLRWDTHRANVGDTERHGRLRRGTTCNFAKLTEKEVLAMEVFKFRGWTSREIAGAFRVSQTCVQEALRKHTWRHVERPFDDPDLEGGSG
jgi:hypothetical protein